MPDTRRDRRRGDRRQDVIYAGTGSAGRTVAMSASSGERIWSAGEGALGPVAVAGGSLFLVNDEAQLVRLDAETGEVIWAVEMPYFTNDKIKRRKGIYAHYGPVLAGGRHDGRLLRRPVARLSTRRTAA
jgi:outer membrane protein assembly factor BamB